LPARPLKTVQSPPAFSDLLFSPRAAFIWNHSRRSVAWMNPAARTAFARTLEDFSKSLPASLTRRFAQCVEKQAGATVPLRIGGGPALRCSVEILKLAGEEIGLIVAEMEEGRDLALAVLSVPPKKRAPAGKPKRAKAGSASVKAGSSKTALPPALSPEEMRAFKAVGRKVRRLCEEKRLEGAQPGAALAPVPAETPPLDGQAAQTLRAALAAFDLVLLLGGGLEIVRVEGRPRMSWSKARLIGKPVTELFPSADQTHLLRMAGKLKRGASTARDFLHVFDAHGNSTLCRAALGRHHAGGAMFFLGVVSLELPDRLKKRSQREQDSALARLAA
jgi:hypothetical protein